MKNKVLLFLSLILSLPVWAAETVEMADMLHQNGKIYVVVGCIIIIFAVLFVYIFLLDRKVSQLEKLLRNKNKS
ncbi:MAG: hypothetical protein KatS3mg034_1646 [Vicingaceae bacterium]|nr:MAG: hypothetical protein KatS3mg034_1646 [Vicingaceae bacterium]